MRLLLWLTFVAVHTQGLQSMIRLKSNSCSPSLFTDEQYLCDGISQSDLDKCLFFDKECLTTLHHSQNISLETNTVSSDFFAVSKPPESKYIGQPLDQISLEDLEYIADRFMNSLSLYERTHPYQFIKAAILKFLDFIGEVLQMDIIPAQLEIMEFLEQAPSSKRDDIIELCIYLMNISNINDNHQIISELNALKHYFTIEERQSPIDFYKAVLKYAHASSSNHIKVQLQQLVKMINEEGGKLHIIKKPQKKKTSLLWLWITLPIVLVGVIAVIIFILMRRRRRMLLIQSSKPLSPVPNNFVAPHPHYVPSTPSVVVVNGNFPAPPASSFYQQQQQPMNSYSNNSPPQYVPNTNNSVGEAPPSYSPYVGNNDYYLPEKK